MHHDDTKYDETDSVGGSLIRLNFREWIMAPQYEYLNNAPAGETETCDLLSPDGVALERHALNGRTVQRFINTAFSNLDDFKKNLVAKELLFFHIFEGSPNKGVLGLLAECEENERVLLLDVAIDKGFLKNTPITVIVTADRQFMSKPLAELRGLGAWAKETFFGFEDNEAAFGSFISKARAFAHADR
jgi:hypothetical protein